MKLDERGQADFIHFPIEETKKIMAVMERAEKTANLKTLQRCARLLIWVYKTMLEKDGTCASEAGTMFHNSENDEAVYTVSQFNWDYIYQLKNDPERRDKPIKKTDTITIKVTEFQKIIKLCKEGHSATTCAIALANTLLDHALYGVSP